jgi:N-acetylmuramoyl-L-alanine amidase
MLKPILITTIIAVFSSLPIYANSQRATEIVAATLILEAGGESDYRAMLAVNEVIHNRAKKRKLSIDAVCLQRLQFSCWNGIDVSAGIAKAKKHSKWSTALRIASSKSITNHTLGSDHYHTHRVNPSWNKRLTKTVIIQNHIFYK